MNLERCKLADAHDFLQHLAIDHHFSVDKLLRVVEAPWDWEEEFKRYRQGKDALDDANGE